MNNEEPINLAHYPDATKPNPNSVPPIERDDFPAPPFPYTDPGKIHLIPKKKNSFLDVSKFIHLFHLED